MFFIFKNKKRIQGFLYECLRHNNIFDRFTNKNLSRFSHTSIISTMENKCQICKRNEPRAEYFQNLYVSACRRCLRLHLCRYKSFPVKNLYWDDIPKDFPRVPLGETFYVNGECYNDAFFIREQFDNVHKSLTLDSLKKSKKRKNNSFS